MMEKTQMIDVLVVGAGPVGLTLAIDLARRGVICRIIEQSPIYQIGTRGRRTGGGLQYERSAS